MKTLIAITNPELRELLRLEETIKKLSQFSEVELADASLPFTSEALASVIGEFDACLTSWGSPLFTPEVLAEARKLKFIGHAAGSVAAVVNEDAFDAGITVTSANKPLALSTAEGAFTLILAGAWELAKRSAGLKQGRWSNNNGESVMGVTGRVVGLVGYGEISRHVIRMLKPLNTTILLHSGYCPPEEAAAQGVQLCSLNELFRQSDIVSLHSTLTPATQGMIGREQLSLLRDHALLVNTARGPIVQEEALLAELRSGRISAALDVYDKEPLPADHELLTLPNALCLPHIAGFHGLLKRSLLDYIVDELYRYANGEELQGKVSREHYGRLTRK
ncbi:Glyoxylate/hydroxypyruvate reductase B [compost metagenome]